MQSEQIDDNQPSILDKNFILLKLILNKTIHQPHINRVANP